MPGSKTPQKVITLRMRADVVDALRTFVKDNAGKPLYLKLGPFTEDAIVRHLAYLEKRLQGPFPEAGRSSNSRLTKS